MDCMTGFDGRAYQKRFDALAKNGVDVHGEATFIRALKPRSVLDAGCGTGRVAIELALHDIDVVGVDIDESMLAEAGRLAPDLTWIKADLSTLALGRTFDVVVLAGNVPLFCPVQNRQRLANACAAHVGPDGAMLAGFQLNRDYDLAEYDAACADAGLSLVDRWSTWDRQPFETGCSYAVSMHRPQSM